MLFHEDILIFSVDMQRIFIFFHSVKKMWKEYQLSIVAWQKVLASTPVIFAGRCYFFKIHFLEFEK